MSYPPIFIETTIQVKRMLASISEQEQLERHLIELAPNVSTSSYVWMEFQRTVIADYAHIHRLMLQHNSWGNVMTHLMSGQRAFRLRSAGRCMQILGLLYDASEGNWADAFLLLEQALMTDLETRFWTNVNALTDPITCDLVQLNIARQPEGHYQVADSCRKQTAACHLPDFLRDQNSKLATIAEYLASHPKSIKNQARVESLLADVQSDPRVALGQNACWTLGDIIIILQAPSDATVWTIDVDFKPLCAALGLDLYSPNL